MKPDSRNNVVMIIEDTEWNKCTLYNVALITSLISHPAVSRASFNDINFGLWFGTCLKIDPRGCVYKH